MNQEKEIALIDSYLEGNLSMEDRVALEERLRKENDLQQLLSDLRILKAGIKQATREEIRSELQSLENKLTDSSSFSFIKLTWTKLAAALAIITVTAWLLWPSSTKTPEQLFAENFEPYPNIIMPTVRGGQASDSTVIAQAYKAYDMQEFPKAIELFESIEAKDVGVLLYLGNSYLANGSAEKAIPVFEKVTNEFDLFDEQAEWFMALSYLKLGDTEMARVISKAIVDRDGSYSSKAKRLLITLNP